jgi:hypothetical protein
MTAYLPNTAVLTWVTSGGTTTFSSDWRTFSYARSQDKFDSTAGTMLDKTYITGVRDFTCSYGGLHNAGGTALIAQCVIGTQGTLTFQPEGTATGKQKLTFPCFTVNDPVTSFAPNALVEVKIDWQGNGAMTNTTN